MLKRLSLSVLLVSLIGLMIASAISGGEEFANSIGMKFALIPAGTFIMGSPAEEEGRLSTEDPMHSVTLSRSFYMQTTEVTQSQWKLVMSSDPSRYPNCGDDCPVNRVSWEDVQEFIRRLNAKEGTSKYRLPSEAEWEYAARAGTNTATYSGPLEILGKNNAPALDPIAWYAGNSCVEYSGGDNCSAWPQRQYSCPSCGPHPVARKQPNAWGLYDMMGNAWEWCQDWYGSYRSGSATDPTGPSKGKARVLRGGGWDHEARWCRSASRARFPPDIWVSTFGFRLVMDVK